MAKLLWTSSNKKWRIYDDTPNMKFKTNWNDPYSSVAQVYVTDSWRSYYASIDVRGNCGFGLYDTYDLNVKTVKDKAFAILRKMYLEKRSAELGKKKTLPIRYFVCTWSNRRDSRGYLMDKQANMKYFTKFETARTYAISLWNKMSDTQREYMYVTIGKFNESYDSVKNIPKNYSYTHRGEISKNNPAKWLR